MISVTISFLCHPVFALKKAQVCDKTVYLAITVHGRKTTQAIGQNQPRVFLLPGNNESFECSLTIAHGKHALFI